VTDLNYRRAVRDTCKHGVKLPNHTPWIVHREDIIGWCNHRFGPRLRKVPHLNSQGRTYLCGTWDYCANEFYFENVDDAVLFQLKWGGL
jgi:hypothetical protein